MSRARTFADLATASEEGSLSKRNLVDNGNFAVHQRGGTITGLGDPNLDRWKTVDSGNLDNLAIEITQSNDTPDGIGEGYSLKYQTKTVESAVASDEFLSLNHHIEAQNLASLCYGTSSAKSITLSFHVKSSLTGTFGFNIYQEDGGDIIGGTYTISSADTWEKKTLTFEGNTGDAIAYDNTNGFRLQWGLWIGSNYTGTSNTSWSAYDNAKRFNGHTQNGLATTDESTWQIAFVQLEIGEVATPFEHIDFATNLARCRRYFQQYDATNAYTRFALGVAYDGSSIAAPLNLPVQMRAAPTFASSGNFDTLPDTVDLDTMSVQHATNEMVEFRGVDSGNGLTANRPYVIRADNDTSVKIQFLSEL